MGMMALCRSKATRKVDEARLVERISQARKVYMNRQVFGDAVDLFVEQSAWLWYEEDLQAQTDDAHNSKE